MAATTKSTTAKKKQAIPSGAAFRKSDWIIIPAGLMVITCLAIVILKAYALTHILTPQYYDVFWYPPVPSLLVAVFGVMYLYKVLHRQFIHKTAEAIAYLLIVIFAVFAFQIATIVAGKGHACTGWSGVIDCTQINASTLYIVFANPYSLTLLSVLAIAGGISLLLKPDSNPTAAGKP